MPSIPSRILVHVATPLRYEEGDGSWVEGEPGTGPEPTEDAPFNCVLFLPAPGGEQQNQYRPEAVMLPTVLYNPLREDGSAIMLGEEDELLIDAPELEPFVGVARGRWQVVGEPQGFGKPGRLIGAQATLRAVRD